MAFPPVFVETQGGGKLLPFQWPFVALPVMCDPVLFDFSFVHFHHRYSL